MTQWCYINAIGMVVSANQSWPSIKRWSSRLSLAGDGSRYSILTLESGVPLEYIWKGRKCVYRKFGYYFASPSSCIATPQKMQKTSIDSARFGSFTVIYHFLLLRDNLHLHLFLISLSTFPLFLLQNFTLLLFCRAMTFISLLQCGPVPRG